MDEATQGILDLARSVLGELDLDMVLDHVLRAAQRLTGAQYAALGVLDDSRRELARFITRGVDDSTHAAIGALPRGRGVLGVLIEDPVPLRLADVSEHPRSYGFPQGHPAMKRFLGVPIIVNGVPFGNLYITEKAGGVEFSAADEEAVVVLAEFAAVAIDHARRYTGASKRRDELERTVAALESMTEVARAVGGETDPDVVLDLIAQRGRALVSARVLLIELKRREELVIAAGAGELPADILGGHLGLEGTVAAQAMLTGRAQRVEDGLNRSRFDQHGLGRRGMRADGGLVVPLVFRDETYGVLLAIDREQHGPVFSAEDERLLQAFASSAATAVATARAAAAERERQRLAAAEEERRRWARELHDETLQSMSALRISLSAAARSQRLETVNDAVAEAVRRLEEMVFDLRALITDLRPPALDELGVQAAIEALAERSTTRGLEVDVSIELAYVRDGPPTRLQAEVETALYRIVQEALTNAWKHGKAKRAIVEISGGDAIVDLSVRDDGIGFEPSDEHDGFGLLGMRERVALVGGEMEIDSAPGRGAMLRVRIPIH